MKKTIALLFALLLLLPSLVFADAIVEPENSFYRTHQGECQHMSGRIYLIDGPDGALDIYTAPGGTVSRTLNNGTGFYCQWMYTDKEGNVWGFSEAYDAWVPMGYTLVQYDYIAFEAEHRDAITDNREQIAIEGESAYLYPYPGGPYPFEFSDIEGTAPTQCYTDEQGRLWGFIPYIYGLRNYWVCLDDPGNDSLTGEEKAPVPSGFEAPAPEELPAASKTGVIVAAVGGVALVTLAVVLILFRRKMKA